MLRTGNSLNNSKKSVATDPFVDPRDNSSDRNLSVKDFTSRGDKQTSSVKPKRGAIAQLGSPSKDPKSQDFPPLEKLAIKDEPKPASSAKKDDAKVDKAVDDRVVDKRKSSMDETTESDSDKQKGRKSSKDAKTESKDDDNSVKSYRSFDDMNLSENLLRGVYSYGYEFPSIIQQRAIVPIISGRDVIAQAQSGTGKTATFGIGVLQNVKQSLRATQVVIVSPTRELATQTHGVVASLAENLDLSIHACIGGTIMRDDYRVLPTCQVVVATPGRALDMIGKGVLRLKDVRTLVLDEADELLQRGFQENIRELFQEMPKEVQVVLVSATMPKEVLDVTHRFMRDPISILCKTEEVTLEGIKQYYVSLDEDRHKIATLIDLYEQVAVAQAIIYCNTKKRVEVLADQMNRQDFTVSMIHGELSSSERNLIMKEFRAGNARVLIATDIIARGIDVQSVSLVINYDIPSVKENYIHRIGRSGRFGRKGVAINFVTERDVRALREIEQHYNTKVEELPMALNDIFG